MSEGYIASFSYRSSARYSHSRQSSGSALLSALTHSTATAGQLIQGDTATTPMIPGDDTPPRLHGTRQRIRLHTQHRRTQTKDTPKQMAHTTAPSTRQEHQQRRTEDCTAAPAAAQTELNSSEQTRAAARARPLRTLLRVIKLAAAKTASDGHQKTQGGDTRSQYKI